MPASKRVQEKRPNRSARPRAAVGREIRASRQSDVLPGKARKEEARSPIALDLFAQRHSWLHWVTPALLCMLLLGQLLLSVKQLSQTADESTHLYAGYRYWKCGDFAFGSEHPPLAKLVAATTLLSVPISPGNCAPVLNEADGSLNWLYGLPDWVGVLFRARVAASVFALGVCLLTWFAARRMFGFTAAVLATSLLVCDPNFLAHGALVTTDVPATFGFLSVVCAYYWYTTRRSRWRLVLVGAATGLALVAKNSCILVLPVLVVLAVADAWLRPDEGRSRWRSTLVNLGRLVLSGAVAVAVVWAVYGLRFRARPGGPEYWAAESGDGTLAGLLHSLHLLPEAYLGGLRGAVGLATQQGWTYILGHMYPHGQWFFFPVSMAVKFTVAVLVLMALAVAGARLLGRSHRKEIWFLLAPAAVFLAASMRATMNSGIRHVLPILPLVLVFCAAVAVEWTRRRTWARYVVPGLLILHAASSLFAFPNYLSYANELWGGPAYTYRYLPENDWGQAYWQVKDYVARHGSKPCWLASSFRMDHKFYAVPCEPMAYQGSDGVWAPFPGTPVQMKGTFFVSSRDLDGHQAQLGGWLSPFKGVTPKDHIAGSAMLVFEGEFDTHVTASFAELNEAVRFANKRDFADGLLHADRSVALDSSVPNARGVLCVMMMVNHLPDRARNECETAQSMMANDPLMVPTVYQQVQMAVQQLHYARSQ